MLIHFLAAVAVALSASATAFAGTCDCSPEIKNASAKVTSSCSKVWSDDQCTLKEVGASSSEARQLFRGKFDHGQSRLEETLKMIPAIEGSKDNRARRLARRLTNFKYVRDARGSCSRREPVEESDLVMVLIDAALTFGSKDKIDFLFDPTILSSVIAFVSKQTVAEKLCTSAKIRKQSLTTSTTVFYGAGCVAYGNSGSYVVTDLGGFRNCTQQIRF